MGDYTGRFTGRAEAYAKYRPKYPRSILRALRKEMGFSPTWVVADVGSGTGILSELFLEHGNSVYGVEPNADMRAAAEETLLPKFRGAFRSVNGKAELTTLAPHSIDLIVVGQALHWFDIDGARAEFARILTERGRVCVLYNDRVKEKGFMAAYGRVAKSYSSAPRGGVPKVGAATLRRLLHRYKTLAFRNSQRLTHSGLLGRLLSASYAPAPGDSEGRAKLERTVRRIFARYSRNGSVTLRYRTRCHIGRPGKPVRSPRTAS